MIVALKDVWQRKSNATVSVDEEYWKLKRGFFNVTANVDFNCWRPSSLGYHGPLSHPNAEVKRQRHVLARSP